ncbi:MAG: ABC transporter ATP-binding protein [Gammaproteobacteria bacterium]|nr:MAG: ABC transporter ATP-binding protein [Gammaproteobacteria bacterium]
MTEPALRILGLNQYYGESHTLWDIDLEVPRGACVCLMGRNGMGKTTLLKTVMGLLPARSGSVRFEGVELLGRPVEHRPRLGIGYVPQGRDIFPLLTVEENLRVGLAAGRGRRVPDRVYELFPVLARMRRRRGGDLSGGQQQQLAIARALVLEPRLLILDEPTEGIQPNIVREIGAVIRRLNRELGLTVLLVEQKLPFARRNADRFVILDKGRVVADGPMPELDDALVRDHLSV